VRQLENAIKRFLIIPDLDLIRSEFQSSRANTDVMESPQPLMLKELSAQAAETAEKQVVLRTLDATGWNRKKAAKELGICYKSLLNKLNKWNLSPGKDSRSVSNEEAAQPVIAGESRGHM